MLFVPACVWPGLASSKWASGDIAASSTGLPRPILQIFPEQTTSRHEISLSGTMQPTIARPFAVQRLMGGRWHRVMAGVTDTGGHFARVALAPTNVGVKPYRVVARRYRVGERIYPYRVSDPLSVTIGASVDAARALPLGQLGTPYAAVVGEPDYPPGTWSLDGDGYLPDGLTLGPDGTVKGTPVGDPRMHSFTARFTDRYGVSITKKLSLRVGRQPTVTPRDPGFSHLLAYDDFQRRPDQSLVGTAADSGHVYDSYYGTYPPYLLDGAYRIDPAASPWNGWSFATLPEEEVPTSVGARFFFDKPAAYGAQEVVLALWRPDSTVGDSSVQFMATPGGWAMFKVINGYRIYPEGGRGGYTTFPSQDGTVYEMSMSLDRATDTVTVHLPDGEVKSWTDPDYSTFWGSTFAVQILRTTSSGDAGVTAMFSGNQP